MVQSSAEIIALGTGARGQERFTSREMVDLGARLERAAEGLDEARERHVGRAGQDQALSAAEGRGFHLGDGQADALRHLTRDGDGI